MSVAENLPADEIWISYGTGKHLRYVAAHEIARKIGQQKAKALPLFQAITGRDNVSFFGSKGKKTAWDVWNVYPALTDVLCRLMLIPEKVEDNCMAVIERFVVLLYDRTSAIVEVNQAREDLFSKKARSLENIPPTLAACACSFPRSIHLGSSASNGTRYSIALRMGMGKRWDLLESQVSGRLFLRQRTLAMS